jgi:hypothetical protein
MRVRSIILVAWCAAASAPGAARGDEAGGWIESDQAQIEILRPGGRREIRTPEGFLRVEDPAEPGDDERLGSFGTYHPAALAREDGGDRAVDVAAPAARPAPPAEPPLEAPPPLRRDGLVDTTAPVPGADPCRPQRARYLRRVLRMSGVDLDRPLDLLDGLAGPASQGGNLLLGGYLVPGLDAVRPLAWDQELRSLGRDLATCEAQTIASTAVPPPPPAFR